MRAVLAPDFLPGGGGGLKVDPEYLVGKANELFHGVHVKIVGHVKAMDVWKFESMKVEREILERERGQDEGVPEPDHGGHFIRAGSQPLPFPRLPRRACRERHL